MAALTSVALIGGGLALAGGVASGIGSAKAGKAQAKSAERMYAEGTDRMNQMLSEAQKVAKPTATELKALDQMVMQSEQQYKASLKSYQDAEKILSSINPAIAAAGDEAYRLIKGQESQVLAPLRAQRERQKSEMESQLAERFGAGYKFSAAGIKAMNTFDTQTADILNQAQFSAMNQVVNTATGLSSVAAQTESRAIAQGQNAAQTTMGLLSAENALKGRQLQPYYVAAQFNPAGAGSQAAQAAGGQHAGLIAAGQSAASLGGNIGQAALMTNLYGGGGAGGGVPSPTTPSDYTRVPNSNTYLPGSPVYNMGKIGGR